MLCRLTLTNFKSFAGKTDIPLSSINIFAGANSSGKSSIIQAILLIKQTLKHSPRDRAIALNGPILKLGSFEDILNSNAQEQEFGISWELDAERPDGLPKNARPSFENMFAYRYFFDDRSRLTSFDVDVRFGLAPKSNNSSSADERRQLQPMLSRSSIELKRKQGDDSVRTEYVTIAPHEPLLPLGTAQATATTKDRYSLYQVERIDDQTRADVLSDKSDARIIGAQTEHCFPSAFEIEYDRGRNNTRLVIDAICSESLTYRVRRELPDYMVPKHIVDIIEHHIAKVLPQEQTNFNFQSDSDVSLHDLIERIRAARRFAARPKTLLGDQGRRSSANLNLDELRPQLEHAFSESFGSETVRAKNGSSSLFELAQFNKWFFSNSVHYLGPLRDEPKPIYPLEGMADLAEVGYRGENTAAVLDLHRGMMVDYVPSQFVNQLSVSPQIKSVTLHSAVVDWLIYLGVAEDVLTDDRGKIGHTLGVKADPRSRFHDLTNVGVGVSQVLPIVVMSLLAANPSLLIFEQPELHLHPKVQARLADFFLSISLTGKQCLLETHSEYLIERFRRRIAEAEGDTVAKLVNIYFTERKGGETSCRRLTVSKYGSISNWPADFFDQSQIETEGILKAGLRKRKQEKGT